MQRRIIGGLNAAGFADLRIPHMAVLLFPGPDGERPGVLADRAGISKQAMNQLLGSLEELGYVIRDDDARAPRARVVRFTRRGHAAWATIIDVLREIEREWKAELGTSDFARLKALLLCVWNSSLVEHNQGNSA